MPKINVYLPDALATAVRDSGVPVSAVCQQALADAVAAAGGDGGRPWGEGSAGTGGSPAGSRPSTDLSRMTKRAREAIEIARTSAGSGEATTVDLVDALVAEGGNLALTVLASLDLDPADLAGELHALTSRRRKDSAPGRLDDAVARGAEQARALGQNYVGCEHLLLGLATGGDTELVARTLAGMGADEQTLRQAVRTALAGWAHARETLTFSGLSAPIRAALEDIRTRLGRLEQRS